MKIAVAGMGIIGGSLALSLKRAGYSVDGWNRSQEALGYALNKGVVENKAEDFTLYDVVFVAMPMRATIDFIDKTHFKDGAVVADICGVKQPVEAEIYSKYRNFSYVGCHPMAGREVSGISSASEHLFDYASMVITACGKTDERALNVIRELTKDMGFGRIVECSAEIHDRKIAYTSQLAHIVSNAYVKDADIDCCLGFTGGSFQDMTRIAGVDENMWAELYIENSANVSGKISSLIASLEEIKGAIDGGDRQKLAEILAEGRKLFEKCKKISASGDISVKKLR